MKKTLKKIGAMLMVLCMVLSLLPVGTLATEDAPELVDGYYEIYNADQLYWFAEQVNSGETSINGKLMADIVVNENVLNADGTLNGDGSNFRVWTPIGYYNDYFDNEEYTGNFDGNGKTVSGLYFNDTSKSYVGLFGYLGSGGKVQNAGVVASYFNGNKYVGGVVGQNDGSNISNCYNTGTISGTERVGGVVGYNAYAVRYSYNTGTISGSKYVGGVVGYNSGTVSGCYNTGSVGGSERVGGVVGYNGCNDIIRNSYNVGTVSGSEAVGGVVGYNDYDEWSGDSGIVSDCYYLSGCVSNDNSDDTAKTAAQFASGEVTYLLRGDQMLHVWGQKIGTDPLPVFSQDWVYKDGDTYANCPGHSYENGFCSCCGIMQVPVLNGNVYEISNADQLYWFAEQVNSGETSINGKLMADIVVNENVLNADGTLNGDGSNFRVWTPIGNNNVRYTGSFDGNGKTVSGLYFNDTSKSYIGLFGYLGSGGKVQNVGVVGSYFRGKNNVGGVAGCNYGANISNCYNTGSVSGSGWNVGGVMGYCEDGDISNCYNTGTVSGSEAVGGVVGDTGTDYSGGTAETKYGINKYYNCYNTGSISGGRCVGGVVGSNGTVVISNCYNTGSVTGSGDCVGGVVGVNHKTVANSYSTGTVSGSSYAGGVVGSNRGTVSNSYNTGNVGGSENVGGVVGSDRGSVTNCYYLSDCVSNANAEGTAMTAGQFASGEVTYLLRDDQWIYVWGQKIGTDPLPVFSQDWVYKAGDTYANCPGHSYENGFCACCDMAQAAVLNGDVYEISNAGQLYWFAAQVNWGSTLTNGRLLADIVVNVDILNDDDTLNGDGSNFRVWTPIGELVIYGGTFDGNDKTISGLYFNDTSKDDVGLIGRMCSGGRIQNVGVVESYFCGDNSVGGVVGYNAYGTVSNCYNTSTVSGDNCGGLVGYNYWGGTIYESYNTGNVNGVSRVGGVVGDNFQGIVRNSYNTGSISGSENVGGVVGFNNLGTVRNSYNTGSISSSTSVGGVVGQICNGGKVSNCYYLPGCAIDGDSVVQNGVGCETQGSTAADVEGSTTAKTLEQFASGEVCWLLSGSPMPVKSVKNGDENPWGQKIGKDSYPVFSDDKVIAVTDEDGKVTGFDNEPKPGVTVSGNVTSFLEGYVTVELLQDGEVVYSITASGGSYAIEGVMAGDYTLRVTKANHIPQEYAITVGDEAVTQDAEICPTGDVTGDGVVNIKDFQRLLRHVNKTNPLTDYALVCGDVTGDGVCNIKDFQRLLRHVNKTNPLF